MCYDKKMNVHVNSYPKVESIASSTDMIEFSHEHIQRKDMI